MKTMLEVYKEYFEVEETLEEKKKMYLITEYLILLSKYDKIFNKYNQYYLKENKKFLKLTKLSKIKNYIMHRIYDIEEDKELTTEIIYEEILKIKEDLRNQLKITTKKILKINIEDEQDKNVNEVLEIEKQKAIEEKDNEKQIIIGELKEDIDYLSKEVENYISKIEESIEEYEIKEDMEDKIKTYKFTQVYKYMEYHLRNIYVKEVHKNFLEETIKDLIKFNKDMSEEQKKGIIKKENSILIKDKNKLYEIIINFLLKKEEKKYLENMKEDIKTELNIKDEIELKDILLKIIVKGNEKKLLKEQNELTSYILKKKKDIEEERIKKDLYEKHNIKIKEIFNNKTTKEKEKILEEIYPLTIEETSKTKLKIVKKKKELLSVKEKEELLKIKEEINKNLKITNNEDLEKTSKDIFIYILSKEQINKSIDMSSLRKKITTIMRIRNENLTKLNQIGEAQKGKEKSWIENIEELKGKNYGNVGSMLQQLISITTKKEKLKKFLNNIEGKIEKLKINKEDTSKTKLKIVKKKKVEETKEVILNKIIYILSSEEDEKIIYKKIKDYLKEIGIQHLDKEKKELKEVLEEMKENKLKANLEIKINSFAKLVYKRNKISHEGYILRTKDIKYIKELMYFYIDYLEEKILSNKGIEEIHNYLYHQQLESQVNNIRRNIK